MIVRPSRTEDLAGIEQVINGNFARVSSLPRDRDKLNDKIDYSMRSFAQDPELAGSEFFLFVLENPETGEILGTSGISVNADKRHPFYSYRLDELIHSSPRLNVHSAVPVLYITHELTGKTVLSSFAIKDEYRDSHYFDLLSRARLLFIASFSELFSDQLVVELQGILSENDDSPFWDSLGRHFFNLDFVTADYYTGVKSRTFLAEMIPAHPVYVPLLSDSAQEVMGKADERAEKTCQLLYREGFIDSRYIDIFDGGPTLMAETDKIFSVYHGKEKHVRTGEQDTGLHYITANTRFSDFRCCLSQLTDGMGDILRINQETAIDLGVEDNDLIRYVSL